MTQISRSFVNGPMISESCREHILELMDLLQLYTSMEQEIDAQEGLLLTNAVISTCDSMLRTYDPQRHSSSDQFPIDSPVFYHIYGSALLSLLFRAISSYPSEISNILEELQGTKPVEEYQEKVIPLRKYQKILVEAAMEYCKEGYQRSISSTTNVLIPNEQERGDSDPGAFDLFDVLGSTVATRELFVESLLADYFINRRELYIPDLFSRISEFEPSISKNLVNEIVLSKSSYFIQNSIFYIQAELELSMNLELCVSSFTVSSMMANDEIAPCEPNWTLDFEYDSEDDGDENSDSEDGVTNSDNDSISGDDDDANGSDSNNDSPFEDDSEFSIKEDIQETDNCTSETNELIQDFESVANIKQQCFTDISKAIGLDCLYLSICAFKELLSFSEENLTN